MLVFKQLFIVALAAVFMVPSAMAKPKPTFSSAIGRQIYREVKDVDGFKRTLEVTASKCQQKSQYKEDDAAAKTCTLKLYCDIAAKITKVNLVATKIRSWNTIDISNVVVEAVCPKKGDTCPAVDKCIDDAHTQIAAEPALKELENEEKAKTSGKKGAQ